jgi:hypothetical protein
MNERIRELAEQAVNNISDHIDFDIPDVFKEKFAELIVRECADTMDGRDENGNAKDGQYLLTQFGIDASQRYT